LIFFLHCIPDLEFPIALIPLQMNPLKHREKEMDNPILIALAQEKGKTKGNMRKALCDSRDVIKRAAGKKERR
jgi:hypothetical protein